MALLSHTEKRIKDKQCNSINQTKKQNRKKSLMIKYSFNPLIPVVVPCSPSRDLPCKRPFNMKSRSLSPANTSLSLSLSKSLQGVCTPHGRTEKSVSWCATSLHMTPNNMSQHVTMITSHSDKNCSLHCNIQTKVRH